MIIFSGPPPLKRNETSSFGDVDNKWSEIVYSILKGNSDEELKMKQLDVEVSTPANDSKSCN